MLSLIRYKYCSQPRNYFSLCDNITVILDKRFKLSSVMKTLIVLMGVLSTIDVVVPGRNMDDFAKSLRQFAGSMYSRMEELGSEENMVFSPASVAHLLGMVMNGAAGETAVEIQQALMINKAKEYNKENYHKLSKKTYNKLFDKDKVKDIETLLAVRIFLQHGYPLFANYTEDLKNYYFAEEESINFGQPSLAADRINGWISEMTEEQITELIDADSLDGLTRLVLANALYFKASWDKKLKAEGYESEPFNVSYKEIRDIPFMGRYDAYKVNFGKGYTQIAIPYKGEEAQLIIAMPQSKEDMDNFISYHALIKYFRDLPYVKWRLLRTNFSMPMFDLEYETDAVNVLKAMGVRSLFDQELADLSKMAEEQLYCSDFKHKAKITVNEEGTVAAASSAAIMQGRSSGVFTFTVDKPFFFTIYREEHILFFGKVMNPQNSEEDGPK